MRIPGIERTLISREKVVGYLLNQDHPDGASKARVLAHAGFVDTRPAELENSLREQHLMHDARLGRPSPFGAKYEITRPLIGPVGTVMITSVWMVRNGESFPRLITIIPEAEQ